MQDICGRIGTGTKKCHLSGAFAPLFFVTTFIERVRYFVKDKELHIDFSDKIRDSESEIKYFLKTKKKIRTLWVRRKRKVK